MYKIWQIVARISLELSILINVRGKEKIKYAAQLGAQIRVNILQGHLHLLRPRT